MTKPKLTYEEMEILKEKLFYIKNDVWFKRLYPEDLNNRDVTQVTPEDVWDMIPKIIELLHQHDCISRTEHTQELQTTKRETEVAVANKFLSQTTWYMSGDHDWNNLEAKKGYELAMSEISKLASSIINQSQTGGSDE